ncbi:MAG: ABC transporter permease [Bacteroidota bacterium]|nr:ABC transporter permease [Bacteroidota bacterium]
MFKSHLVLAIRNLLKRKLYSFINIFGLAIGVAVCLVILKFVDFELSYDSFHKNAENIYRTTTAYYQNGELRGTNVISGYAQGTSLKDEFPEVKNYIRTHPMYGGAVITYTPSSGNPVAFHEEKIQYVDSTFLDVFTYKAIEGNMNTALDRPNSIVLTRSAAIKYFGKNEDPIGKLMKLAGGWSDGEYEVTAVLENVPGNSHFYFEFLFPIHNLLKGGQYQQDDGWGWNNFYTYIELYPNTDARALEAKLPAFVEKYRGKDLAESNGRAVFGLQPIRDIHLSPGLDYDTSATTSINSIYFYILISIFILAIAWVNYINLSTARAMERAREVGIKKSIGALKGQLVSQFIFESVLVNFLGVVLALLFAMVLLPVLADIVGKDLSFDFADYRLWLILFALFITGSFISGLYPAFVLSSFKITTVLKGVGEKVQGGFSLRKALVVFQFASSLILIAGTFAIYRQIVFMRGQDKGLTMEQMLVVSGPSILERETARERLITLKNEIKQIPGVAKVATSAAIPGGGHNWGTGMRKDGDALNEDKNGRIVWIDPDFIDTYGITVLSGRNFNPAIASDMNSVLVNEAAVKTFGLGDPEKALTERMILGGDTTAIVGVLKNFHWASLKSEHEPWLFKADTISGRHYSILLSGNDIPGVIKKIESKYDEAFPGNPFDYFFLDDFFNSQYKAEQQFASIFGLFAILAIVIACLGLWGLAAFTTTQKLKEIGIRKVLGASVYSIISLLSWQFFKLVFVATVIAIPLTWYGIDTWLRTFAFRIGLEWDLFVVPVVILAIIALGTVSTQIFRGANTNPARILRTE